MEEITAWELQSLDPSESEELWFGSLGGAGARCSLEFVGTVSRNVGYSDLRAITHVSGDTYWAASDTGGKACELVLSVDVTTGRIYGSRQGRSVTLQGCSDVEGLAYDPLTGFLWAADEANGSISAHRQGDGTRIHDASVPPCYERCHPNQSLESLTIREDGLEMWTCNESPMEGDGDASTKTTKALVRLSRFVWPDGASPWRFAGQWAYPVGRLTVVLFEALSCAGLPIFAFFPTGRYWRSNVSFPAMCYRVFAVAFIKSILRARPMFPPVRRWRMRKLSQSPVVVCGQPIRHSPTSKACALGVGL